MRRVQSILGRPLHPASVCGAGSFAQFFPWGQRGRVCSPRVCPSCGEHGQLEPHQGCIESLVSDDLAMDPLPRLAYRGLPAGSRRTGSSSSNPRFPEKLAMQLAIDGRRCGAGTSGVHGCRVRCRGGIKVGGPRPL